MVMKARWLHNNARTTAPMINADSADIIQVDCIIHNTMLDGCMLVVDEMWS